MVLRAAAIGRTKSRSELLIQGTFALLGSRRASGGLLAEGRGSLVETQRIRDRSRGHSNIGCREVSGNFGFRRWTANLSGDGEFEAGLRAEIGSFNRGLPVEEAWTPPSSWYTSSRIFDHELQNVFEKRWLAVGRTQQLQKPGDYFTGKIGRIRYVVCLDEDGTVRAFHNVCRHHAAAVATGSGCTASFACPYHGWTYGLDGRLRKASRLGGIQNFSARENGLLPIRASTWGPFVLISSVSKDVNGDDDHGHESTVEDEWLGGAAEPLAEANINSSLAHVRTREYKLNCNWKVFCDNYLDGGYHVPYAHLDLASNLNLKSYDITLFENVSIQSCQGSQTATGVGSERVGEAAVYAFVYPNLMINRYGPWMDTNLVIPLTPDSCLVVFDYYLEASRSHGEDFVEKSLHSSDVVQQEDIALCEAVQDGLQSPAYDVGRYAPKVEHAMHHFHCLLHDDLAQCRETICNRADSRRLQRG